MPFKDPDKMRNYMKERRSNRRAKFIQLLGGKCIQCGSKDNLEFDHVHSGWKRHDYNDIRDSNENLIARELKKVQLLCHNCHRQKSHNNGDFINKDKKPVRHGTIWGYKKLKCRCSRCKKAMREYLQQLKIKKSNIPQQLEILEVSLAAEEFESLCKIS